MKTAIASMLLVITSVLFAQVPVPREGRSLLDRARKGDDSALSEMERTGDVKDLHTLLNEPHYAGKRAAQMALARMGDTEILQYYACRSLSDDIWRIEDLMREDLDYIGGDFTIELYRHLLDSDSKFRPQLDQSIKNAREHGGDTWPQLPSTLAVSRLSKLVPDSSIPGLSSLQIQSEPQSVEELKARWKAWIDTHQLEIRKLKPSAKGVHFEAEYCSKDVSQYSN